MANTNPNPPSIPAVDVTKSPFERGLKGELRVSLFVEVDKVATVVGTAELRPADVNNVANGELARVLHGKELPEHLVACVKATINPGFERIPYPYSFHSLDDLPQVLGELVNNTFSWDVRAMSPVSSSIASAPQRGNEKSQMTVTIDLVGGVSDEEDVGVSEDVLKVVSVGDENSGKEVKIDAFSVNDYEKIEVSANITQLVDPEVRLRPTNAGHEQKLLSSIANNGYDYSLGYMLITPREEDCDPDVETFLKNALRRTSGSASELVSGYVAEVVDGGHRKKIILNAVQRPVHESMLWALEPLRMYMVVRKDRKRLSAREKLMIAKNSNIGSGIVLVDKELVAVLSNISSYAKSFEMHYGVSFCDARIADIVTDMQHSRFLGDMREGSYKRYVRVGKLSVACEGFLDHMRSLITPGDTAVIGITHLDHGVFLSAGRVFIPHLLTALHAFLSKNVSEKTTFHGNGFYAYLLSMLKPLYAAHRRADRSVYPTLESVLDCEMRVGSSQRISIRDAFLNAARLYHFVPPRTKNATSTDRKNTKRVEAFVKKVKAFLASPPQDLPQPTGPSLRDATQDSSQGGPSNAPGAGVGSEAAGRRGRKRPDPPVINISDDEVPAPGGERPAKRRRTRSSTRNAGAPPPSSGAAGGSAGDGAPPPSSEALPGGAEGDGGLDPADLHSSPSSKNSSDSPPVSSISDTESPPPDPAPPADPEDSDSAPPEDPAPLADPEGSKGAPPEDPAPLADPEGSKGAPSSQVGTGNEPLKLKLRIAPAGQSDAGGKAKDSDTVSDGAIPPPTPGYEESDFYDDRVPEALPVGVEPKPEDTAQSVTVGKRRSIRFPPLVRSPAVHKRLMLASLLESLHIEKAHRANVFFNSDEVMRLGDIAHMMAAYWELSEAGMRRPRSGKWDEAQHGLGLNLSLGFFQRKAAEVRHLGYTTLEGFACPTVLDGEECPEDVNPSRWESHEELLKFIVSTYPGPNAIRIVKNRKWWNPIITGGVEKDDEAQNRTGLVRAQSVRRFVMEHLESHKDRVWAARRRALQDVWSGWLCALLNLDDNGKYRLHLPATGGRYLITPKGAKRQTGHQDFPVLDDGPGYFIITTGDIRRPLYVADSSHKFLHYGLEARLTLAKTLKMRKIFIPKNSIFIGHGYLQHAGAEGIDDLNICYHQYLRPGNWRIMNNVFFGYDNALGVERMRRARSKQVAKAGTMPEEGRVEVKAGLRRRSASRAGASTQSAEISRANVDVQRSGDDDWDVVGASEDIIPDE